MRGSSSAVLIVAVVVVAVAAVGAYFVFGGVGGSSTAVLTSRSSAPAGGAPGGGPPGMAGGGSSAFEEFRKTHQYTFQLSRLAGNIGRLEKDKKAALKPEQARAILAVLKPLRKQESMDQEQAKAAIKDLQKVMTDDQRAAISTMAPEHRFRREGGPSGDRPRLDMKAMENFNPFNPPKDSPMYERSKKRMDDLFAAFEKKAGAK